MDSVEVGLENLINWQTVVFAITVYILVFLIRRIVEGIWKALVTNYYWNEIGLTVLPAIVGVTVAILFKSYPYPVHFTALGGRVMFGLGCGFFSGWAYANVKAVVKKATGVDVDALGPGIAAVATQTVTTTVAVAKPDVPPSPVLDLKEPPGVATPKS